MNGRNSAETTDFSFYSLPRSDGMRKQIFNTWKHTVCPFFHLCCNHVGVLLAMEECCYSLPAPPSSPLFPIPENSTSTHPVSHALKSLPVCKPFFLQSSTKPYQLSPQLSHHHHSPRPLTPHQIDQVCASRQKQNQNNSKDLFPQTPVLSHHTTLRWCVY